jgi:hypothetical protein
MQVPTEYQPKQGSYQTQLKLHGIWHILSLQWNMYFFKLEKSIKEYFVQVQIKNWIKWD